MAEYPRGPLFQPAISWLKKREVHAYQRSQISLSGHSHIYNLLHSFIHTYKTIHIAHLQGRPLCHQLAKSKQVNSEFIFKGVQLNLIPYILFIIYKCLIIQLFYICIIYTNNQCSEIRVHRIICGSVLLGKWETT